MKIKEVVFRKSKIDSKIIKLILLDYIDNNMGYRKLEKKYGLSERCIRKIIEVHNANRKQKTLSDFYKIIELELVNNRHNFKNDRQFCIHISEKIGFHTDKIRVVLQAIKKYDEKIINNMISDKEYNSYNNKMLSEKYSIPERTIGHMLKLYEIKNNIEIINTRPVKYKNKINTIFKNIDSKEKAYWLGFIYADGHVSKNTVSFGLSIIDKEHLYKFSKFIGEKLPVVEYIDNKFGTKMCKLTLGSKVIARDLLKYTKYTNKTYNMIFPNMNDEFLPGFILGYFDGDGCVYKKTNKRNAIEFTTHSNNINFLENMEDKLLNNFKIVSYISNGKDETLRLRIHSRDSIDNFYKFYEIQETFLERKKNKFIRHN